SEALDHDRGLLHAAVRRRRVRSSRGPARADRRDPAAGRGGLREHAPARLVDRGGLGHLRRRDLARAAAGQRRGSAAGVRGGPEPALCAADRRAGGSRGRAPAGAAREVLGDRRASGRGVLVPVAATAAVRGLRRARAAARRVAGAERGAAGSQRVVLQPDQRSLRGGRVQLRVGLGSELAASAHACPTPGRGRAVLVHDHAGGVAVKRMVLLGWVAVAIACVAVGAAQIEVPLQVAGTAVDEPVVGKAGAQIELDRAELAFGPIYLCAGAQAGELCDTAQLEWLDAVVIDALDPAPVEAGRLRGREGTVRSWMFDLGVVSLLTQKNPLVLAAAEQLGGASLRIEGRAELDGVVLPFAVAVVVRQEEQTE